MTEGFPSFPPPLETEPRRRPGWIIAALLAVVLTGSAVAWWQSQRQASAGAPAAGVSRDDKAVVPPGVRVRTRVINATGQRGLARRATLFLRDYGYDIVDFDTQRGEPQAETVIHAHGESTQWADGVRRALGVGRVTSTPDSLRYLDVSVIIGRDWQPPAEPLRP